MIPLSVPNFEGNEENYVLSAVSQGWVSTGGAYVNQLEEMIGKYTKSPLAVVCQSGTAGIHLALIESDVTANDMVIVPTLTFIAAVNPVRYLQADPIFMDCDDDLCMDPKKLEQFCEEECDFVDNRLICKTTKKQIKALIVVHVFGNIADMEEIMEIAQKYNIVVIEDATEALGSYYITGKYKGAMAGTIGDFGIYSFNGNKIITTGGGGAIVGKNKASLEHIKYLSTQAKDDEIFYVHNEVGYNYRMTNVQAALGVAQMEELEEFIDRKNKNYDKYESLLDDIHNIELVKFKQDVRSNKWFYSILLNDTLTKDVRTYVMELQNAGVQTRPIWGLIHEQKPYAKYVAYKIEKAKKYASKIINIPSSTSITDCEIEKVVNQIVKAAKYHEEKN